MTYVCHFSEHESCMLRSGLIVFNSLTSHCILSIYSVCICIYVYLCEPVYVMACLHMRGYLAYIGWIMTSVMRTSEVKFLTSGLPVPFLLSLAPVLSFHVISSLEKLVPLAYSHIILLLLLSIIEEILYKYQVPLYPQVGVLRKKKHIITT